MMRTITVKIEVPKEEPMLDIPDVVTLTGFPAGAVLGIVEVALNNGKVPDYASRPY